MAKKKMWTDTTEHGNSLFFEISDHVYEVKLLQSLSTTMAPVNVDYRKIIDQKIKELKETGKKSLNFNLVAAFEKMTIENGKAMASFLLPGTLNQVFKVPIDPKEASEAGQIGLNIGCNIKQLK